MTDELDETEALAAEYALGTLEPTARAAVQQRLRTDPELARLVELWEQRLAPLAEAIPPVEPPPAAWLGLAQAVAAEARPAPLQRVRVRHHGPLYSVTFWRRCALGAGALAAVLALYVAGTVLRPPATPSAARYVAVLDRGQASPALIVTVEPDGRARHHPAARDRARRRSRARALAGRGPGPAAALAGPARPAQGDSTHAAGRGQGGGRAQRRARDQPRATRRLADRPADRPRDL